MNKLFWQEKFSYRLQAIKTQINNLKASLQSLTALLDIEKLFLAIFSYVLLAFGVFVKSLITKWDRRQKTYSFKGVAAKASTTKTKKKERRRKMRLRAGHLQKWTGWSPTKYSIGPPKKTSGNGAASLWLHSRRCSNRCILNSQPRMTPWTM